VKGWKIYQANGPQKQAGVAILILDKVDFKPTPMKRDKEGHSILIKGKIHQKETTIINLYAPNINEGPKNIYKLQHSGSERL
jgi:exonuclease III